MSECRIAIKPQRSCERERMLKHGELKDPARDAGAADVLAAFEAAQGNGLPSVDCYRAAVEAWRHAHPDHTAAYAAQQAVRIVLDARRVCG